MTSPFTIEINLGTECCCDTCGCFTEPTDEVSVTANGEPIPGGKGSGEVSLPSGTYALVATSFSGSSPTVTITVDNGESTDGESTGTDDLGVDTTKGGCGCSTATGSPALAGLAIFGLLALRRRRAD
ncbi:MYXO-CTERM sorting domain-containing protein [Nannocystaceae bacterium ST9]